MKNYFKESLGVRGIVFFCSCLAIILAAMTVVNVMYQKNLLENTGNAHVQELGKLILTAMRHPMLNGDQDVIQKQFDGYRVLPGLNVAHLTDKDGIIRRSTDMSLIGQKPKVPELESALQGKEFHGVQVRQRTGKKVITEIVPIHNEPMCTPCHGSESKILGVVRLGIDWESTAKSIGAARNWNIFLSIVGLVMMSLLIAVFFLKAVVFPIRSLETGMKKVSEGNLSLALDVRTKDEIGDLTRLFNKMAADLKTLVEKEERKAEEVALLNQDLTREISLRNRLEMNLIESRRSLEDIINFLPDATFAVDTEGKIIAWNKAMEVMSGQAALDMIGKGNFEYSLSFYGERRPVLIDVALHPEDDSLQNKYPGIQKRGNAVTTEAFAPLLNNGKGSYLWVIATTLYDAKGSIAGAIASVRDVTDRKAIEAGLEKEKTFIDSAINSLPGIFYLLDINGRFVRWNRNFEVISGYSYDEMSKMNAIDIFAQEEKDLISQKIRQVFSETRASVEASLLSKNGKKTPFVFTGFRFVLDGQQYLVGMGIDISERKNIEDKLRASEAQLANALMIAHLGPWEYDVVNDLFIFNDHFYALFRTNAEREGGYTMPSAEYARRFVHPEDAFLVGEEVRKTIEAGRDTASRQLEHRIIYRDGATGYISVLYFLVKDKDGRVVKTCGVNQDITARKKIEMALKESEQFFASTLNDMYTFVGVLKLDGEVIFTNNTPLNAAGLKLDDIKGKKFYDLFWWAYSDETKETIKKDIEYCALGNSVSREIKVQLAGGLVWLQFSIHPIYDDKGGVKYLIPEGRDISDLKKMEENLRRTHQNLMDIIEFLPDATFVIDKDKRVIAWNKAIEGMTGVLKADIIGKDDYEYSLPFYGERRPILIDLVFEDIDAFKDKYENISRENYKLSAESFVPGTYQGKGAFLAGVATPLFDEKGSIVGAIETIRDITDSKKAEEALWESREHYRAVVDNSPLGIAAMDTDYKILMVNSTFAKLFRKPAGDFVGKYCFNEFEKRSSICPHCPGKRSMVSCKNEEAQTEGVRDDGSRFYVHNRTTPFFAPDGSLKGFIEMVEDVTERKKAEEELQRLRQRTEFVLGATKTGLDIIDSEYNLRYVDPQWAKIYGPYAGKKCYEYFASRVEACEGCGIRKALEEKIPVVSEEILVKEGNRPIQVTTLPFQDENGEWLVAEVNVDISERKKAEEAVKNAYAQLKDTQDQLLQASKMAAIGQLAGGVAHEINNPLTGVLNNVQLIKLIAQQKKEFNMDDFKVLLDAIEESSLRCTKITKSLLEFSRASKENRQAVNLNETIQKVTGLIEHEMKLNNIGICQELDPALPAVNADIQLVQQVIFDIISNAAWAIHSRKDVQGGTITLKTEYDSWNRNVYLIISDTGIGIEKKSLERIFDPFFTTKPVGQGTGLGLAIVYNIIKDHKGTVEVQSELGQGTRFKITLPAVTSSTA